MFKQPVGQQVPYFTGLQVTAFDLNKQREADQRQAQDAAAQRDMAQRREVGQQDYERLVETENVNAVDGIDARDVDTALAQLSVGEECAAALPRIPTWPVPFALMRSSVCHLQSSYEHHHARQAYLGRVLPI